MSDRTFFQNPCKRGKNHNHLRKICLCTIIGVCSTCTSIRMRSFYFLRVLTTLWTDGAAIVLTRLDYLFLDRNHCFLTFVLITMLLATTCFETPWSPCCVPPSFVARLDHLVVYHYHCLECVLVTCGPPPLSWHLFWSPCLETPCQHVLITLLCTTTIVLNVSWSLVDRHHWFDVLVTFLWTANIIFNKSWSL